MWSGCLLAECPCLFVTHGLCTLNTHVHGHFLLMLGTGPRLGWLLLPDHCSLGLREIGRGQLAILLVAAQSGRAAPIRSHHCGLVLRRRLLRGCMFVRFATTTTMLLGVAAT